MMTNAKDEIGRDDFAIQKIDPKLDAMIGSKLRGFYDDLMAEPVPSRILDLIAQLDAKERSGQSGTTP